MFLILISEIKTSQRTNHHFTSGHIYKRIILYDDCDWTKPPGHT